MKKMDKSFLKKRLISLIKKFTELNLKTRKIKLGGEN